MLSTSVFGLHGVWDWICEQSVSASLGVIGVENVTVWCCGEWGVFRAVLNLFALPGSPRSWCHVLSQASVCGSNVIVFAHVYHELTRHLKISKSFTHIILVILTTTQWSKYYYHHHIVDEGIEAWRGKCFAQGYSTWKWWILHFNPGSLTFNNYHMDQSNCF